MTSKVLETAALQKLYAYLSNFEVFYKFQSAHRKNHFFETVLCKIYNELIINIANGESTLLVQLELSAAFDTVDVTLMLGVLQGFGIDGNDYKWFLTYLRERQFKILINESYFEVGHMKTRVPQGRVLGPVLFAGLEKT